VPRKRARREIAKQFGRDVTKQFVASLPGKIAGGTAAALAVRYWKPLRPVREAIAATARRIPIKRRTHRIARRLVRLAPFGVGAQAGEFLGGNIATPKSLRENRELARKLGLAAKTVSARRAAFYPASVDVALAQRRKGRLKKAKR
jgi:hypothetical protein